AADDLPGPADVMDNFLLFGFQERVPSQIPRHQQGLSLDAKFALSDSTVIRMRESAKKTQLGRGFDEFRVGPQEEARNNDEETHADDCGSGRNLPSDFGFWSWTA